MADSILVKIIFSCKAAIASIIWKNTILLLLLVHSSLGLSGLLLM